MDAAGLRLVCAALALVLPGVFPGPAAQSVLEDVSPAAITEAGTATVTVRFTRNPFLARPTDVILVADRSGSLDAVAIVQLKNALGAMVQELTDSPACGPGTSPGTCPSLGAGLFAGGGKLGVITYSSSTTVVHPLSNSLASLLAAINNITGSGSGNTCTNLAIDAAAAQFAQGSDPSRRRIAVIITDGQPNCGSISAPLAIAKQAGIEFFSVGVGSSVSPATLAEIAQPNAPLSVASYAQLSGATWPLAAALTGGAGPLDVQLDLGIEALLGPPANASVDRGVLVGAGQQLTWLLDDLTGLPPQGTPLEGCDPVQQACGFGWLTLTYDLLLDCDTVPPGPYAVHSALAIAPAGFTTGPPATLSLACDPWSDQGSALPGVAGPPQLAGAGPLTAGSANSIELSSAAPSALAGLFVALASAPIPFKGGTLLPNPFFSPMLLTTSPAGTLPLPFVMPVGVPPGTELWLHWAIQDATAVHGVALSNAVLGVVP